MTGGPTMLQTLRSAFCVVLSFMGGVAKVRIPPFAASWSASAHIGRSA